ncbi:MAG: membrane protein insertion efficiency factor YidD [Syntrophales bacterium]
MSERPVLRLLGRFCIALIRAYQICVSPFLLPCCRFTPTCSEYAIDAISSYGPLKGSYLALTRLLRCHPFHPGGYDPVK